MSLDNEGNYVYEVLLFVVQVLLAAVFMDQCCHVQSNTPCSALPR